MSPQRAARDEGSGSRGRDGNGIDPENRQAVSQQHGISARSALASNVLLWLLAIRILNALAIRTFFQPDEYFQSLEPAWEIAFGTDSGAWTTWEWKSQLRSSIHPGLFAGVYLIISTIADFCSFPPPLRAELLMAAPKITQALFAAFVDYFTWRLAEKIYGKGSRSAGATLALTVFSAWQWFCSTRTLSNCLETTLTSAVLYLWPWHWIDEQYQRQQQQIPGQAREPIQEAEQDLGDVTHLRFALLLAAVACILRPTNILIWLCISIPTLRGSTAASRTALIREALLSGSAVLAFSVLADRAYYLRWAFPPFRFLYFNIAQSLAVFYGRNRRDYYLTEGLPLLLTTALPFAAVGLWQALSGNPAPPPHNGVGTKKDSGRDLDGKSHIPSQKVLQVLGWTVLTMTVTLSLISHKEVRFLYPVLPILHILSASLVSHFFPSPLSTLPIPKKALLGCLLGINIFIAGYTSQVHQRGVIDVLHYLRHEHESFIAANVYAREERAGLEGKVRTTVGFLMPCHSTPWRSHLVYPDIEAWALTCEPPLDVPLDQRNSYMDEADVFYDNPTQWLKDNMGFQMLYTIDDQEEKGRERDVEVVDGKYQWPDYLVFFQQLEPVLEVAEVKELVGYRECWRGFNTHFHDDWRRQGDVVVWCMREASTSL